MDCFAALAMTGMVRAHRLALAVEPKMANDFLRGHIRRIDARIQPQAISPRHGGEIVAVELSDQVFS